MKQTFKYCVAIAFGGLVGWFAEPEHRPHQEETTEQLIKINDSLQLKLNHANYQLNKITDSLYQVDGE